MKASTLYKTRQPLQKATDFEFADSMCILKTLQGWVHGEGRPLVFLQNAVMGADHGNDANGRHRRALDDLPPEDGEGMNQMVTGFVPRHVQWESFP